jgi:ketosteroid isomerase-like protein
VTAPRVPVALPAARAAAEVRSWLAAFADAVRRRDEGAGLLGFGTVARRVEGLDRLAAEQWGTTWPVTSGFDLAWDDLRVEVRDDVAWAAAPWASTGFDPAGRPFPRRGRATVVLARGSDGRWRAVHTHFSLDPAPPPRT